MKLLLAGWCLCLASAGFAATATVSTNKGKFVIELASEKAPRTVAHFVEVARSGFYKGKTFHKVVPGRLIHGGAAKKDGTGGPGYCVDDEFHKELRHAEAGVVSLVSQGSNTGGSQFVITLAKVSRLDNRYSVFGKVVSGMEVIEAIAAGKLLGSRPAKSVVITGIEVAGKTPALKVKKRYELDEKAAKKVVEPIAKQLASSIGGVQKLGALKSLKIQSVNSRCNEAQIYTVLDFEAYKKGSLLMYGTHDEAGFDVRQFQFARGTKR